MLTDWHHIPVALSSRSVAEVCCKLDLSYARPAGWHLQAVLVDGEVRLLMDGSVTDPKSGPTDIGKAIATAASVYFDERRDVILGDNNLSDEE